MRPPNVSDRVRCNELVHQIETGDTRQKRMAASLLQRRYDELVDVLITAATREKIGRPAGAQVVAPDVLGHIGASKAIPYLVHNIEDVPSVAGGEHWTLSYPNVRALHTVGLPSLHGIVIELPRIPPDQLSDRAVELYAHTVLTVFPNELGGAEEAIHVIRAARNRAHFKDNFDRLIAKLEQVRKDRRVE